MVKTDWRTINVKNALLGRIEKGLKTGELQKEGITNISQFIDVALKEKLNRMNLLSMAHVNMYDDHVKILDRDLGKHGRIVSVYFKHGENSLCDYCNEIDCVHVQYAWEIPEVKYILKKKGLTPPPSRID